MANVNLLNTLELIDSSRIKDRNEGLLFLKDIIESNVNISPTNMTSVSESLFSLIDLERSLYAKNESPAALTRLNDGAYLLRKLITKDVKKLKMRLVDAVLEFIKSRFFDSKGDIFTHLAVNLSKILHTIVLHDSHRNHLSQSNWISLISMIIRALNSQFKKKILDNFLQDLLPSLKYMLKDTMVNFDTTALTNLISTYFTGLRKHDSSTPLMLEISNQSLIIMSTTNVYGGLKVVKAIASTASYFINSNYESLKDQFLIFCLISSEYIGNSIPKLIDEDGINVSVLDINFRDTLAHLLDKMLQNYIKNIDNALPLDKIMFSNGTKAENRSWVDFQTIRLHDSKAIRPWLSLLGIVTLLNSLYTLEKSVTGEYGEQTWKKRKLDSSFIEIVNLSSSSIEFIANLLKSSSTIVQSLGLRLLIFHVHNFKTDPKSIEIENVFLYSKPSLSGWVSLSIKTLLEYGWESSNELLSQALRINLQMLKDTNYVNVASQTSIQIISCPSFALTDRSLIQLIESIFEISQINGPAILTNDSLKFWVTASGLVKFSNFGESKTGDKIIDWLLSKWDTIIYGERLDALPSLIGWLSGSVFTHEDKPIKYDTNFTRIYHRWANTLSLSRFILRNRFEQPSIISNADFTLSSPIIELLSLEPFIDNLLITINSYDNHYVSGWLVEYIGYGALIYEYISPFTELSSSAKRIIYDIRRLLENLKPSSEKARIEIVKSFNDYGNFGNSGILLAAYINKDIFITDLPLSDKKKSNNIDDFAGFDTVRTSSDFQNIESSLSYYDLECIRTVEQEIMKFILKVNSSFNLSHIPNSAIDEAVLYLGNLSCEQFCNVFHTFLDCMKERELTSVQTTSVKVLLRQFGIKLLATYQFQKSPIGVVLISNFISTFSKFLRLKSSADLINDFSDIFQWYLSLAKKGEISEEHSQCMLLKAMFEILTWPNCSKISDPSEMTELAFNMLFQSSNNNKVAVSATLEHFLSAISWKSRISAFDNFVISFDSVSSSDELSASFLLCLNNIGHLSFPFFTKSICLIVRYYENAHFLPYCENITNSFLKSFSLNTIKDLSTVQLLELFEYWFSVYHSFDTFPFALFDYSSLASFIEDHHILLYAIIKSRSSKNELELELSNIQAICGKESDTIQLEALSFLLPLAYTRDGIRNRMNQYLEDLFGELVGYQSTIIIYNFFQLIDLSDETFFFKFIPNLESLPYLKDLFTINSEILYSNVNVRISFSDALHQISLLSNQESWTPDKVLFLVDNISKYLQNSKSDEESTLILRRLKLLLIIGAQGFQSKSDDILSAFLNTLSPYLSHKNLHEDISKLIVCAINMYPGNVVESKLYPSGLFRLFYHISNYKDEGNITNLQIQELVIELYSLIDNKRAWKSLLLPFINTLKDHPIDLSLDTLHQTLKYASQVVGSSELKFHILEVMTLVFQKDPELSVIPYGFRTNKDVARLLLEATESDLSQSVVIFISRYLGRYFLETGDDLKESKEDFERSIEYDIETKSKTLHIVFDKLVKLKTASKNLKEISTIHKVLGKLLYDYNRDPKQVEQFIDFDKHLSPFVSSILPLDLFTFNIITPYSLRVEPISSLSIGSAISDLSSEKWAQVLCISLLNEIENDVPVALPLIKYLSSFPKLSLDIVNHIWLLYVHVAGKDAAFNLLQFVAINIAFCSSNTVEQEKILLLLNLCFFIRICAKEEMKYFRSVYRKLDLNVICELSTFYGLNKFALVLFEENFNAGAGESLSTYTELLTNIYEGLKDMDLLYGIPVEPSLDYAINVFNKREENSWKRIMFNSAMFDGSSGTGDIKSSRNIMLKSLASNSMSGLSNLVNDFSDPFDKLSNSYDWSWKLDKWDLPNVVKPQTESEYIYNVLKPIKDKKSKFDMLNSCQSLMTQLLSSKHDDLPVLKTLCTLHNVETIINVNSSSIKDNIKDTIDCTEKWFKFTDFSSLENLLLTRKTLFESSEERIGKAEAIIATAQEISRYGTFARIHNENQRSANSAVLLTNIVKIIEDEDLKALLTGLSNFEAACTLWNQGETVIPIAMLEKNLQQSFNTHEKADLMDIVKPSNSMLNSYLVKWNSASRQKKFENIMEEYVEAAVSKIDEVSDSKLQAEIYHTIGYFCYKRTKISGVDEDLRKREMLVSNKKGELKELKAIILNQKTSERDRKEAKRCFQKIQFQYDSDKNVLETLQSNQKLCVQKSIEFFLKTISIDNSFDDEDVDKFCALWLELSEHNYVNDVVEKEIYRVPSYKFIPWINQLVSRLSNEDTSKFQKLLQDLLVDICHRHPFHSLYYIKNLQFQKDYEISLSDKSIISRIDSATAIWKRLMKKGTSFINDVLIPVESISKAALDLATFKGSRNSERKIYLENLDIGKFWLKVLPGLNVPLPTSNYIPISLNSDYSSVPRIVSANPHVSLSPSGISLPKILKVTLNDGSSHRLLLKGGTDDLRQDAIMEQVFEKVNIILQNDRMARKRNLKIRTYKVVPLGPTSGMIEFVADSIALSDILRPLHSKDKMSFEEARVLMKKVQSNSTRDRLSVYLKICKDTPPAFRFFFYETFVNVDDWYKSRQIYTKGIATTSIIGHVLGLGDRHLNNILIDKKTGEPIHIDFGVAFDQGKQLPIPETVPFRLTRDLVDGLGVTGVKGSFEKSSEHVFRVMKENVERIISMLDVLKYDPLYIWAISPIRKRRLQDSDDSSKTSTVESDDSDAGRAVKGVEEKLVGDGLSVDAGVQQLIQEAIDPKNLSVIYLGWSPFY